MRRPSFSARVLAWFDRHGRHDLPWQTDPSPYRTWVAEIMLQQTQVNTVIPYFERFTARFADAGQLADAELDEVLGHWTGLGYYARARNLHRAARQIRDHHGGELPVGAAALATLPGIGRSTAGAIASIAQGKRAAILDGNVKRVLARHCGIDGWPGTGAVAQALWQAAETLLPRQRHGDYSQAMMDLGATLCHRKHPQCQTCPVAADCHARIMQRIDALPGRKPKRDKPVRRTRMLLLQRANGDILLRRRADDGIWGGMWSFPETGLDTSTDTDAGIDTDIRTTLQQLGIDPAAITEHSRWNELRHTFTHFHLDIAPQHMRLTDHGRHIIREPHPGIRWVAPDDQNLGRPAPVVRLMAMLADSRPVSRPTPQPDARPKIRPQRHRSPP